MGRRQSQTEKEARKAERSKFTLKGKMVSSGMLERYEKSVTQFLDFAKDFNYALHHWEDLDELASKWVEHIYHDGCHKTLASDGLAGLQFYLPAALGRLKHSWKLAKVWQMLEPPRRVLPLSPTMVKAMAGAALGLGFVPEACGMLVAFDTMLRSGELYQLKIKDISFYGARAVLSLGYTKTGKRNNTAEMVVVESPLAIASLKKACVGRPRKDFLLARGQRVFRSLFSSLVDLFGLDGLITVYSLRRGGASWDFLQHQSMERTLLRGRWQSTSSARLYLQDATAMVTELQLSSSQKGLARAAITKLHDSLTA